MRRILLVTCGVLLVVIIGAIVLFTDLLSARTWLAERALFSTNADIRGTAAKMLVAIDPEAALESFLVTGREVILGKEVNAFDMFRYLPPHFEGELAAALGDPDPARAHAAAEGIEVLTHWNQEAEFPESVAALARAMRSDDPSFRTKACIVLAGMGPRARGAAPALSAALSGGLKEAAFALGKTCPADVAIPPLVEALSHADREVRTIAVSMLGDFADERAKAGLLKSLSDEDAQVVEVAFYTLSRAWCADREVSHLVIDLAKSGQDRVRGTAAAYLVTCWSDAPGRIAALETALREPAATEAVLHSIYRAESPPIELLPVAIELLRNARGGFQGLAALALGSMGPEAGEALPALREAMDSSTDPNVTGPCQDAISAISGIPAEGPARPPRITKEAKEAKKAKKP